MVKNDTQTGILGKPSASCVQRLDDSRVASHISYRTLLRSSSLQEPRDPLLKVVLKFLVIVVVNIYDMGLNGLLLKA